MTIEYVVANLNDAGPGSLRQACEAEGPRVVRFAVAGTIRVVKPVRVRSPFLIVEGETAFQNGGGGVTLRDAPFSIQTHDVEVRYMRFRLGDVGEFVRKSPEQGDALELLQKREAGENPDLLVYNVVIDHCSGSWGVDEIFSVWNQHTLPMHHISFSWCIISEGLNNSIHPEGDHSKGLLVGDRVTEVSIHHNLFAFNSDRNPVIQSGRALVTNNVIYGCKAKTVLGAPGVSDPVHLNYIANQDIPTHWDGRMISIWDESVKHQIFAWGNRSPRYEGNEWSAVGPWWGYAVYQPHDLDLPAIPPESAEDAVILVLAEAGASLWRDEVDRRIVADVTAGTGGLIDSQSQVGGWSELPPMGGAGPQGLPGEGQGEGEALEARVMALERSLQRMREALL